MCREPEHSHASGDNLWFDFKYFYFAIYENPNKKPSDFLSRKKVEWGNFVRRLSLPWGLTGLRSCFVQCPSALALIVLLAGARSLSGTQQQRLVRLADGLARAANISGDIAVGRDRVSCDRGRINLKELMADMAPSLRLQVEACACVPARPILYL